MMPFRTAPVHADWTACLSDRAWGHAKPSKHTFHPRAHTYHMQAQVGIHSNMIKANNDKLSAARLEALKVGRAGVGFFFRVFKGIGAEKHSVGRAGVGFHHCIGSSCGCAHGGQGWEDSKEGWCYMTGAEEGPLVMGLRCPVSCAAGDIPGRITVLKWACMGSRRRRP